MVYVHTISLINALGRNNDEILKNWSTNQSPGMAESSKWLVDGTPAIFGCVQGGLEPVPGDPHYATRNNALLWTCFKQKEEEFRTLIKEFKPERIAVILGTSTSGSDEADQFVTSVLKGDSNNSTYDAKSQEFGNPSEFLAQKLGIKGPAFVVSTACTSSTRAIISGVRLINSGIVDAALVGGVDTLARSSINGFNSLEALSKTLCKPLALNRAGITIGEGAGLIWLSKKKTSLFVAGYGESSDGHHISAPEPEGKGAEKAMREALERADLIPEAIDYINLHGTATQLNDSAEAKAVNRVFGQKPFVSSTKNLTGHTLGAAGVTDAGLVLLALADQGKTPLAGQFAENDVVDPKLALLNIIQKKTAITASYMMSNNFAFGGNNASLVFGYTKDYLTPEAYLPHKGPMCLLNRVLSVTPEKVICEATTKNDSKLGFFVNDAGNYQNTVAIELMAQTIGVWAGFYSQKQEQNLPEEDRDADVGLLLSARELKFCVEVFPKNASLKITMYRLIDESRLTSFEGEIKINSEIVAKGRLNVFQPTNKELNELLRER